MGQKFTVYTDQKSLQYLIKFNEEASAKVVRWQASLLAYDFDIIYRPGKLNANADALSRLRESYSKGPELEEIIEDYYLPLNGIKHGRDNNEDEEMKKLRKIGEENVFENTDGMTEAEYNSLVKYIISWEFPAEASTEIRKAIKNKSLLYEVINGELFKKANTTFVRRKVVGCQEVLPLLKQYHDHLMAGHQGISRTFNMIKEKFYWSGYYDTVRRYVSSCQVCQSFGPRNLPTPLSLNPKLNKEGPFSHISIDYIYLPLTSSGNNAALMMIDKFTGWVECKPTSTQSSDFTCISLFEWICTYGKMIQIHCDNGVHFNTEEVKVLKMSSYGIQLRFGVPYHPQGQGKVERANGVLKSILKKYAGIYRQDWDAWLSAAVYVMRTSVRGDHGYSAFFLAYGRNPREILEGQDHWYEYEVEDNEDIMILDRIEEIFKLNLDLIPKAKKNIMKYEFKMIERYNRAAKSIKYKVSDMVLVLDRTNIGMSTALLSKWVGPFRVSEVVGQDIYVVKDGDLRLPFAFHANQMKLYKARPRLQATLKYYSKKNTSGNTGDVM